MCKVKWINHDVLQQGICIDYQHTEQRQCGQCWDELQWQGREMHQLQRHKGCPSLSVRDRDSTVPASPSEQLMSVLHQGLQYKNQNLQIIHLEHLGCKCQRNHCQHSP